MSRDSREERLLAAAACVGCLAAYLPIMGWLTRRAADNAQALHSALAFLFVSAAILWEQRERLRFRFRLTRLGIGLMAAAFAALGMVAPTGFWPLSIVGLSLALASIFLCVVGGESRRSAQGLFTAFGAFAIFAALQPWMDWPLRALAAKNAGAALGLIGFETTLALAEGPSLVLLAKGMHFVVAPECNGFGLIASALIVGLALSFSREMAWLDRGLAAAISLLAGFMGNLLRIIVIVMLAPLVGDNYFLMHEIAGTAAYWATLIGLWRFIAGFGESRSRGRPSSTAPESPRQAAP